MSVPRSFASFVSAALVASSFACSTPPAPTTPAATPGTALATGKSDVGGRLYDKWFAGKDFEPDASKTPGAADGTGGPFGNGTLPDASGQPLLNDNGSDYRFKNLFAWDLHGNRGVYGKAALDKAYSVDHDLLADKRSPQELAKWLSEGDAKLRVPAYGKVLSATELLDLATFITDVRDRRVPHPDDLFKPAPKGDGGYALLPGGDASRGKSLVTERCTACHGMDGTKIPFDGGEENVGTLARKKAFEVWAKIVSGHPGSPMGPQLRGDGAQKTKELRDVLAALCDRTAYPKGAATQPDVADGDKRCGADLK